MNIGYVRVSSEGQNTARQELLMKELGVERVFVDVASGKSADRPQLQEMLDFVREGDTVTVSDISRFARNTRDLLDLVDMSTTQSNLAGYIGVERPAILAALGLPSDDQTPLDQLWEQFAQLSSADSGTVLPGTMTMTRQAEGTDYTFSDGIIEYSIEHELNKGSAGGYFTSINETTETGVIATGTSYVWFDVYQPAPEDYLLLNGLELGINVLDSQTGWTAESHPMTIESLDSIYEEDGTTLKTVKITGTAEINGAALTVEIAPGYNFDEQIDLEDFNYLYYKITLTDFTWQADMDLTLFYLAMPGRAVNYTDNYCAILDFSQSLAFPERVDVRFDFTGAGWDEGSGEYVLKSFLNPFDLQNIAPGTFERGVTFWGSTDIPPSFSLSGNAPFSVDSQGVYFDIYCTENQLVILLSSEYGTAGLPVSLAVTDVFRCAVTTLNDNGSISDLEARMAALEAWKQGVETAAGAANGGA